MHRQLLNQTRTTYLAARELLVAEPERLIELERVLTETVETAVASFIDDAAQDYDEASRLYPFWQNFPPDARGRAPKGDQFPWIEVGEHSVGRKLARHLPNHLELSDLGFPTGPDERFLVSSPEIRTATDGLTDSAWLAIDIKSVGPRDDQPHTVMSHNQVSGSGEWEDPANGVDNRSVDVWGKEPEPQKFYPALPPLLVLNGSTVVPTVTMAMKPVYSMKVTDAQEWSGQPLSRLDLATIPNGLLLCENPNYLEKHRTLFFPSKDEKSKPARKRRARVRFKVLQEIAPWRMTTLWAIQ